jgi:hypothetical protein
MKSVSQVCNVFDAIRLILGVCYVLNQIENWVIANRMFWLRFSTSLKDTLTLPFFPDAVAKQLLTFH